MKRKITRVLAALFAMVMVFSCMSLSAFASGELLDGDSDAFKSDGDDTTPTPTFVATQGTAKNNHIYELYQIFTGEVTGTDANVISNAFWGANHAAGYTTGAKVDNSILNALQNLTGKTESEKLEVITKYVDLTSTPYNAVPNTYVDPNGTSTAVPYLNPPGEVPANGGGTSGYFYFDSITPGYYLIKDKTGSLTGTESETYTLYVVQATDGTLNFAPKGNAPTVDKYVSESADAYATAGASGTLKAIGENVQYTLKGTVADLINSYKAYYYKFTDTLTKGLTYNNDAKIYLYATKAGTGITTDEGVEIPAVYVTQDVTSYFYKTNSTDADTGKTTLTFSIQDLKAFANIPDTAEVKDGDTVTTPAFTAVTIDQNTVVYVTYSAMVNENAVASNISTEANKNTVDLTYYNDPNNSGTGTEDPPTNNPPTEPEPDPKAPTDDTTDETVLTFTASLTLEKQNLKNEPLNGAVFSLTLKDAADSVSEKMRVSGSDVTFTKYTGEKVYDSDKNEYNFADIGVKGDDGKTGKITSMKLYTAETDGVVLYWQLKNGSGSTGSATEYTYTTRNPYFASVGEKEFLNYVDPTVVYTRGTVSTTPEDVTKAKTFTVTGTVDNSGMVTFEGLGAGTYTVKEVTAPVGYQTISDFDVTLSYVANPKDGKSYLVATSTGTGTVDGTTAGDGSFHIVVADSTAQTLPSTGGIGTTIFYVVGSALAIGAIVLLITKKRMNNEVG